MTVFTASRALVPALVVVLVVMPATGAPQSPPMRVYSMRMESLFHRLDGNQNGRLELHELQGQRALQRRLKRQNNRSYLLLDDLRSRGASPSGPRLQRHFQQADRNRDQRLNRQEAQAIPWIARHFKRLDENRDGTVTLAELWRMQRLLAPPQRRP